MDIINKLYEIVTSQESYYIYFNKRTAYKFYSDTDKVPQPLVCYYVEGKKSISVYNRYWKPIGGGDRHSFLVQEIPLEVLLTSKYKELRDFARERLRNLS